ncbi:hypothetical protein BJX66DRAFT_334895 [Aspergillus keveii]|uniref:Uncharacterized protein n=1 Tax=Aspergillus keveii TaxID=714993 RepID=A0ABR4GF23_9EURO
MVSFNPLNLFKSSKTSESTENQNQNPTFDPNTLTMVQPGRTEAPSMEGNNGVVSEQPGRQEPMEMQLRGGGGGGFCCGM